MCQPDALLVQGFFRCFGSLFQQAFLLAQENDEHPNGNNAADHIRDGRGPYDSEDGQKPVQQERMPLPTAWKKEISA